MARLLRFVGPWPIRPGAVTGFFSIFAVLWAASRLFQNGSPGFWPGVLLIILGLLSAVLMGACLRFFMRLIPRAASQLPSYLLVLASTAAICGAFRVTTGQLPVEPFPSPAVALLYSFARLMLFQVVTLAITGLVTKRLDAHIAQTELALAETQRLQRRFVEADERTRAQAAAVLHDRVQAGIIAACLELRDVAESVPASSAATIDAVIGRLEQLRDLDVRGAARALSPDLASQDLQTALEDLRMQYAPAMATTVQVAPSLLTSSGASTMALLAAYRIAEQALLNAAIHGRARRCWITVAVDGLDLRLTVRDDGIGLQASGRAGVGSLTNDTWAAILGGSWRLANLQDGAELTARIPMHNVPAEDHLAIAEVAPQ